MTEGESKIIVYAQSMYLNNYTHINRNMQMPSHTYYTQKFNHPCIIKNAHLLLLFIENVLKTIYSKMILELNLVAALCSPCILGTETEGLLEYKNLVSI